MLVLVVWASGFWGSNTAETPVVSIPITPNGHTFVEWEQEGGEHAADSCAWWNGTYYYDPGACNAFSITRIASGDVAKAIERASHCAVAGDTDCVLNGEIGFSIPSAFLYDSATAEMRMLIAPRYVQQQELGLVKTIKMQDPYLTHPTQLFEFNSTIAVEYLKGGARTVATEDLTGQNAYCVQALRRSIAPACWESLD